jgi:hypothetical protein
MHPYPEFAGKLKCVVIQGERRIDGLDRPRCDDLGELDSAGTVVEGVDAPLIAFPPFSLLLHTLRSISLRTAYLFCTYIWPNITLLTPNYEHPRDQ